MRVHGRKLDLLRVKRRGASHSDFLMKLEEIFRLVEYERITGPIFLTQLFLEQANAVILRFLGSVCYNMKLIVMPYKSLIFFIKLR